MIFWRTKCDILFCNKTLIYYMLSTCWENGVLQVPKFTKRKIKSCWTGCCSLKWRVARLSDWLPVASGLARLQLAQANSVHNPLARWLGPRLQLARQNIRSNIDSQPSKENMTKTDEKSTQYKGVQCHECEGYGHIRTECATFLKRKKKSLLRQNS